MTALLIIAAVLALAFGTLLWIALCQLSGDLAQREEDEHGVDKARRS